MSRQVISNHYTRLAARWPADIFRPDQQLGNIFRQRIQQPPVPFRNEEKEVNAAYLLLDNAISKQFPLPEKLLQPASNPEHYSNLKKELDELPHRTWLSNLVRRLQNMVRLK